MTNKSLSILIADESLHNRRLVADVVRAAGIDNILFARDGEELLQVCSEFHPKIVITTSRLPKVSGLEFTRTIRAGYGNVNRALSIIVMTTTPTRGFLDAARASGVDEMLVCPYAAAALLARVEAVILRPRRFIDSANYVGPCRRRRMLDEYAGPMRRFSDPLDEAHDAPWEAESNRELMRMSVSRIAEAARELAPGDRRNLRNVYTAVKDAEQLSDDMLDESMGAAARSLGRYINGIGASPNLDTEVITTHVDAMQKLGLLKSANASERQTLVDGLVAVVDKRLGRAQSRAA